MENSRTTKSLKNIKVGLIVSALNVLFSFFTRTVFVKTLGEGALGLNGLFSEIIAVISLAELGVGMAIVYYLYKPIHDHDEKKINELMSLYKKNYNFIALTIFSIGVLLTLIVHFFISDLKYPLYYIRIVFFIFVLQTSSSYLFSYKASLLNADQKNFIVSLINCVVNIIFSILLILLLIFTHNFIAYLILKIFQSLASNIWISFYVDKHYTFLTYNEKLSKDEQSAIFKNIKNIFIKRVSGVVTSSTDNILISTLVSTVQVGLYSNYLMIFKIVRLIRQQLTQGLAASIGDLTVNDSNQRKIIVLRNLTFVYFVFGNVVCSILSTVSSKFITFWIGSSYVMKNSIVYLAVLNLFIEVCCDPLWQFLEVSGLFNTDKNIAIIGSLTNLIVSILLGIPCGIIGIFIGTVCTQVIQLILKTILIYKKNFQSSYIGYFLLWIKIFCCYILSSAVASFFVRYFIKGTGIFSILFAAICSFLFSIILVILFFYKNDEFKFIVNFIKKYLARK